MRMAVTSTTTPDHITELAVDLAEELVLATPDDRFENVDGTDLVKLTESELHDLLVKAIQAGTAAELRRMATEGRKAAEDWGSRAKQCVPGSAAWESAVVTAEKRWFLVSHLDMRAAELDGGAR